MSHFTFVFSSILILSILFTSTEASTSGQETREPKQLFMSPYLLFPDSIRQFSPPNTRPRVSYFWDPFVNQPIPPVHHQKSPAAPLVLANPTESRFQLLKPFNLIGSCNNNFVESILDRCCDQSACDNDNRFETITLCKDVPSSLFGAALSSAPNGKVEGIGSNSNVLCGAYMMAYSPFTKLQIKCPVIDLSSPFNIQIFDGSTIQPIQPTTEVNVVYTTLKSIGFILVQFTRPEDKFTCEWKAIV